MDRPSPPRYFASDFTDVNERELPQNEKVLDDDLVRSSNNKEPPTFATVRDWTLRHKRKRCIQALKSSSSADNRGRENSNFQGKRKDIVQLAGNSTKPCGKSSITGGSAEHDKNVTDTATGDRPAKLQRKRRSVSFASETICQHFSDNEQPYKIKQSSSLEKCIAITNSSLNSDTVVSATPKLTQAESLRKTLSVSKLKTQLSSPLCQRSFNTSSIIEGPTAVNFKLPSDDIADAKSTNQNMYMCLLSVELHINTIGSKLPDPEYNAIAVIFYSVHFDYPPESNKQDVNGAIVIQSGQGHRDRDGYLEQFGCPAKLDVTSVQNELDAYTTFEELFNQWNPDFVVGYEVEMLSWAYLCQRAVHLGLNFKTTLSRIIPANDEVRTKSEQPDFDEEVEEFAIPGRVVLNLWRIIRHEITLNVYTFENVAYHVLHRRYPLYTFKMLTQWWNHRTNLYRYRVVAHYAQRTRANLDMLLKLDLLSQNSELARVFGIEFYHVLSRGSQYRVESMLARLTKSLNFVMVSPSIQQRARMKAPECIQLTLEPEANIYTDPVVVLDFQSLYPSIMIAYNICYSTCLGRIEHLHQAGKEAFNFGCTSYNVKPLLLKALEDDVFVSPNGIAFVKQTIRRGVLSKMLDDVLRTRFMVKRAMKYHKDDAVLQRLLHARQLGLKLLANTTYGYTSANYSGRMPCVEISDSILRKSRETLERAIKTVEDHPTWNCHVVYGDTDSLFILMKGRSKEEAFRLGHEIANTITDDNPKPVKLKFEKVYLPCVLQTKKRYVGYMFERPDQVMPKYDAKGIETVRRDNCGVVAKILERSIKLYFDTLRSSLVRQYVTTQLTKLLQGRFNVQDCIFAKEYRGRSGYRPGTCVPALEIAKTRLGRDRRSEPRRAARVPYVIVYGSPGLPLIQLVREPQDLLDNQALSINVLYYITKQILPPLDRIFSLIKLDVRSWYNELPRTIKIPPPTTVEEDRKGTIAQFYSSGSCAVCGEVAACDVCEVCAAEPQASYLELLQRGRHLEKNHHSALQVCYKCMNTIDGQLPCVSIDCSNLFAAHRATRSLSKAYGYYQIVSESDQALSTQPG